MTTFKLERRLDEGQHQVGDKVKGGTFGRMYSPNGVEICRIVERPFLNNEPYVSCIPVGKYKLGFYPAGKKFYPKYKKIFADIGNERGMIQLLDVPGRTHVLIHRGNVPSNSWACLLPNESVDRGEDGYLRGYSSTSAYRVLYSLIADSIDNGDTFLEIKNTF